ncbi:MAG TPA: YCF48-related protein [Candidatus Angelobacter sp.]
MPELPNLLRQRLAATESGEIQAHPDADTLTAYMEQSLPAAESKTVIAHLAVCEPCREVVAVSQALMVQPDTQTVLAPAPATRWRRLFKPVFGAAAAVTAMAVIAVMVLQLPQKNVQQSATNTNSPASQPAQETQQAKATVGDQTAPVESKAAASAPTQQADARLSSTQSDLATSAKETEARLEDSAKTRAAKKLASTAPTKVAAMQSANGPVLTAALPKKDYINTNFFNSSSSENVVPDTRTTNLPPAPVPQLGATNSAFNTANNKIAIFADLPTNAAGNSNVRLLTPPPAPEHLGCTVCKIVQSTAHTLGFHSPVRTPALRAGALSSSALGGPGMFSGAIEKSQPAELSAAPARADADSFAASSSLSISAMAPTLHKADSAAPMWKVVDGKLMKSSGQSQWEDAYPVASSTMEFSFVNARGNDVWAGGSHASLIHSRDGGQTWDTIKLGDNASGTIVSIIAGTMSVQVKTSDNQTWASADGGKTWMLRGQ